MRHALSNRFGRQNLEAPRFHGAGKPREEGLVVINKQQGLFVGKWSVCHSELTCPAVS
jgi:hypothetical protein